MTTIVANGDYLIADHRITWTEDSYRRFDLKSDNPEEVKDQTLDTFLKVTLPTKKLKLLVNRQKVLAWAISGTVSNQKRFGALVEYTAIISPEGLDLGTVGRRIDYILAQPTANLVGITEDGLAFRYSFTNGAIYIAKNSSEIVVAGSGGSYAKDAIHLNKNASIIDIFSYASYMDKHSSTSYSVFGRKENIMHRAVFPSQKEIVERYTNIVSNISRM